MTIRKKLKAWKTLLLALGTLSVLGASSFLFFTMRDQNRGSRANSYRELESLRKQLMQQRRLQASIPGIKTLSDGQNVDLIREQVLAPKNEKERQSFLIACLHEFEQMPLERFNPKSIEVLRSALVALLAKADPLRGNARSVVLAARLLGKLPEPRSGSAERAFWIESVQKKSLPDPLPDLLREGALGWSKPPKEVLDSVVRNFQSESSTSAIAALNQIDRIRDVQAKAHAVQSLYRVFHRLPEPLQPLAFKVLLKNRSHIGDRFDSLIGHASRQNTEAWWEAYLQAVASVPDPGPHLDNVRKIERSTASEHTKRYARAVQGRISHGRGAK